MEEETNKLINTDINLKQITQITQNSSSKK